MATKKTVYHSELAAMGPVRVTVLSDVMPSKFSKPGTPRPDWVALKIGNEDKIYTVENESCGEFFQGQKGRTFTLVAEGSREQATLTYVGEAAPQAQPQRQYARPKPHTSVPPPSPEDDGQEPGDDQIPGAEVPARGTPPPAARVTGGHAPVHGATVGMCLKEACSICGQIGTDPFSPEYYRQVHEIASDLIRVALHLEAGKLAPSAKDRQPKE